MSRIAVIFLALLIAPICNAQRESAAAESSASSRTVFGVKGGFNISKFSASVNSETRAKLGMALGIYLKSPIGEKSFFRPELYYSNQGQKDNYIYPYGGPSMGSTTTSMHYIELPLLFEIGRNFSFQFGPQIGLLVASKEKGEVASVRVNDNLSDVMTTADLSIVVGVGYSPGKHLNYGVRAVYGITNIYVPPDDNNSMNIEYPDVHNRVFHFYVAYSF